MRRLFRIVAVAAVLSAALPASAFALRCAPSPYATPAAAVTGERSAEYDWPEFFDQYDFAVVGTVGEKGRARIPGAAFAHSTVTLDVLAAFGTPEIESRFRLTQTDRGGNGGFRFKPGDTYFIPILAQSPSVTTETQGVLPNFSFACDPIFPVEPSEATDLLAVAPEDLPVVNLTGVEIASDDPAMTRTVIIAGGLTVLVVIVVGAGLIRRPRSD